MCDCEPVHVRIEFPWWSRAAIENRTWGKEQTVEELPDGGCILSFTTGGKFDLLSWIRSFGSDIRVLEPESIRSEIIADLKHSLMQYENDA